MAGLCPELVSLAVGVRAEKSNHSEISGRDMLDDRSNKVIDRKLVPDFSFSPALSGQADGSSGGNGDDIEIFGPQVVIFDPEDDFLSGPEVDSGLRDGWSSDISGHVGNGQGLSG